MSFGVCSYAFAVPVVYFDVYNRVLVHSSRKEESSSNKELTALTLYLCSDSVTFRRINELMD